MYSGREGFLLYSLITSHIHAWRRNPYLPFPEEGIALAQPFIF